MEKNESKKFESLYLKNQVCFPAYAVANKILRRYQPLLKELDLTYTQYITMMVLWEKRKVNEKDLVEALYLKANTLTDLLKKLEAKGYVTISKDKEDKRNIIISLTDKGLALRDKAVDIPSCIYEDHWLTDEEFLVFKGLLEKMLKGNW